MGAFTQYPDQGDTYSYTVFHSHGEESGQVNAFGVAGAISAIKDAYSARGLGGRGRVAKGPSDRDATDFFEWVA